MPANPHDGSLFDDFLKEEGIYDEITARTIAKLSRMSIQLSPNSNEGLRQTFNAASTPIGQYRAAYIHMLDRQKALVELKDNTDRRQLRIKQKKAEIEGLQNKIMVSNALQAEGNTASLFNDLPESFWQAKVEELQLDLAQMERQDPSDLLGINDAVREIKVCQEVMAEAEQELGVSVTSLSEVEFQQLMTQEAIVNQQRKLTAALLSSKSGLLPAASEMLSEMKPDAAVKLLKSASKNLTKFLEQSADPKPKYLSYPKNGN